LFSFQKHLLGDIYDQRFNPANPFDFMKKSYHLISLNKRILNNIYLGFFSRREYF